MKRPLLFAAVAVATVLLPTSAHATYSGGKGNIAFIDGESDRGGAGETDLRLIGANGKTVNASIKHCGFAPGDDSNATTGCPSGASFSRRGSRLAFAIDDRLAVAAANGSSQVLLPRLTDEDNEPAWTSDGKLLFTGRKNGKLNLYVVNADGSHLSQLTQGGGRAGAYSSRGLVVYTARGYVRLIKADGSGGRRLARGANPDFSPSGKTVVFDRQWRIYRKGVKQGSKRRLVIRKGFNPVFSPTGKRVLYVGLSGPGYAHRLLTVSPRGKKRHKVFDAHTDTAVEEEALFDPAWQPRR